MAHLTERQAEVFEFIKEFRQLHEISPTVKEIAKALHVTPNAIQENISRLHTKGAINKIPFAARSITPAKGFRYKIIVPVV
jgi:SOS-response transcriptional repressor LexA